jgi:hypothetical protein
MPRASDNETLQTTLAQRPTLVRTQAIQDIDGSLNTIDSQHAVIHNNFTGRAFREVF